MPRLFDPEIFDPEIFDTTLPIAVAPAQPPTLESALAGHHWPVARLQFLEPDMETVRHEATALIGGTVTMDRARDVNRQGDISLGNEGGLYSPTGPGALVWPSAIVRIQRGARVGSVAQYRSILTGIIGKPRQAEGSSVITFQVWGRLHLADRRFSSPLHVPAGTPLEIEIRTMLEAGGFGTSDALYDLDDGGTASSAPRTYDTSERILASAVKRAYDGGCDLYENGDGAAILRPWPDPLTLEPTWTFEPGLDSTLVELEREINETVGVVNRAVATGVGPDRYPITGEAKVTNPADPLFWTPDNDRPAEPYPSADITNQAQANAVALRRLYEGALYEEALAASAAANPLIADRLAARFRGAGVDDVYLLDRVDMPVGEGLMPMRTRKIRSLIE
jgi:hypothetical protein